VSGCRETLVDEVTGFIYHAGDVGQLCQKIEKFLAMNNENRKKMGERGRKKVEAEFSRSIVVKAYLKKIKSRYI